MYYSTIMYIYYITRYYTKISLSTLYYTMYCKNTKYTVYPRLFRCSCLLLPSGSLYSINRVFGWFLAKRTKDCHQCLESVWPLFTGFGGKLQGILIFFYFQLENERLGKWHFIRRAMKNI